MSKTFATETQIATIRARRVDNVARDMMANGVMLTHDQAYDLGDEAMGWLSSRLGLRINAAESGVMCEADAIVKARATFRAAAEECGSDAVSEEQAILSVGREFLPPCALAMLDDGTESAAYYEWLTEQVEKAQAEHDAEVAAGHEWHA